MAPAPRPNLNISIDELIDSFDHIPDMMTKLNANVSSPKRYSIMGPNHSYRMGTAIAGHSPTADARTAERMRRQAERVLEHLSAVHEPKVTKELHEAAEHALVSLQQLAEKPVVTGRGDTAKLGLKGVFGQFDIDKRGRITYDDFCDTLHITNTGIGHNQGQLLASEMDTHKTGELEYSSILDALRKVSVATQQSKSELAPVEVIPAPAAVAPVQQDVVVVSAERPSAPSAAAPGSSSSGRGGGSASSSSSSSSSGSQKRVFFSDADGYLRLGNSDPVSASSLPVAPAPEALVTASSSSVPPTPRAAYTFEDLHNPSNYGLPVPPAAPSSSSGSGANAPPAVPPRHDDPSHAPRAQKFRADLVDHIVNDGSISVAMIPEGPQGKLVTHDRNSESAEFFKSSLSPDLDHEFPFSDKRVLLPPQKKHLYDASSFQPADSSRPSESDFKASLSSMLFPPLPVEELYHSARGRGEFARAELFDHIVHDGTFTVTSVPGRRMSGPGQRHGKGAFHDHNLESPDLIANPLNAGSSQYAPYHTDDSGHHRPSIRTSRKHLPRSRSAPSGSRAAGTHYAFFYGSSDDTVGGVMSQGRDGLGGGDGSYNNSLSDEHKGDDSDVDHHQKGAWHDHNSESAASEAVEYSEHSHSLRANPAKSAPSKYESPAEIAVRLRENAILSQVGGRFNYLRHVLKKTDAALSGYVNYGEFKSAMARAGVKINDAQTRAVYEQYSQEVDGISSIGKANSRALKIEQFVDEMQSLSRDPSKAFLPGAQGDIKVSEDRRIAKKVLHSLKRVQDPMSVFKALDTMQQGWVRPDVLRAGLTRIGTTLTDNEFDALIGAVDTDANGKIEFTELDTYLKANTHDTESAHEAATKAAKKESRRYSNTFHHNIDLEHSDANEFATFLDSDSHRASAKSWDRLQHNMRQRAAQILSAFTDSQESSAELQQSTKTFQPAPVLPTAMKDYRDSREYRNAQKPAAALRSLSITELGVALGNAGVQLGRDDLRLLEERAREVAATRQQPDASGQAEGDAPTSSSSSSSGAPSSEKIGLDDFCSIVGLGTRYSSTNQSGRVEVTQPSEALVDGGIFNSSTRSHHAHDTFASSMFQDGRGESGNVFIKGNCKRKSPIDYEQQHILEPHKFFELKHAATGDLWPTNPATFFRGSLDVVDKPSNKSIASPAHKSMRRMHVTHRNDSSLISHMGDYSQEHSMRSHSRLSGRFETSPRRGGRFGLVGEAERHMNSSSAPIIGRSKSAPRTGAAEKGDAADRWASKPLAEFIAARESEIINTTEAAPSVHSTPSVASVSSPTQIDRRSSFYRLNLASSGSGAAAAMSGYKDSVGLGGGPIRSLRKRPGHQTSHGPASSPFANDFHLSSEK